MNGIRSDQWLGRRRNLVRVGVARSAAQALPVSGGYVGAAGNSIGLNVDVRSAARRSDLARPGEQAVSSEEFTDASVEPRFVSTGRLPSLDVVKAFVSRRMSASGRTGPPGLRYLPGARKRSAGSVRSLRGRRQRRFLRERRLGRSVRDHPPSAEPPPPPPTSTPPPPIRRLRAAARRSGQQRQGATGCALSFGAPGLEPVRLAGGAMKSVGVFAPSRARAHACQRGSPPSSAPRRSSAATAPPSPGRRSSPSGSESPMRSKSASRPRRSGWSSRVRSAVRSPAFSSRGIV